MLKAIKREYVRIRKAGLGGIVGEDALSSLRIARTIHTFNRLDEDYVRVVAVPDESPDLSHLDDLPEGKRKAEVERLNRDGVWVVVSEFRTDTDSDWQQADCIGGCDYSNPTSPYENCYVPDLMSNAIDQLREALKGRYCKHCGHRAA